MTETPSDLPSLSDAELITSVRTGDTEAFGELFSRHVAAARGVARRLTRNSADVDDLVSEAFENTLKAIRAGRGPDEFFRAYLLTTVSNITYRHSKRARQAVPEENLDEYEALVPHADPAVATFEAEVVAQAFASLPERWQAVLWHTEIDDMPLAEIGALLGLSANAVAALAHRAREGLREAYLQAHIGKSVDEDCKTTAKMLGGRVRRSLSRRDEKKVDAHLKDCLKCSALALELEDVGHGMRALLFPVVAGVPFLVPHLGAAAGAAALLIPKGAGAAGGSGAAAGATSGAVTVAIAASAAAVIGLGAVLGVSLVQQARHDNDAKTSRHSAGAFAKTPGDAVPAPNAGTEAPAPPQDPADTDAGSTDPADTETDDAVPQDTQGPTDNPTSGNDAGGEGDPVAPPASGGTDDGQPTDPGETAPPTSPVDPAPPTDPTGPPAKTPPPTGTPTTDAPPTDPPASDPPTDPPPTDAPPTDAPPTDAPPTDPPATDPTETDPPVDPPDQPVTLDTSISTDPGDGPIKRFTYTVTVPPGETVKDATIEFRLSDTAIFSPLRTETPPGWSCDFGLLSGPQEASCHTTGPVEGRNTFEFDVIALLPGGSDGFHLSQTISGDDVEPTHADYNF